jgi:hypothetical protein
MGYLPSRRFCRYCSCLWPSLYRSALITCNNKRNVKRIAYGHPGRYLRLSVVLVCGCMRGDRRMTSACAVSVGIAAVPCNFYRSSPPRLWLGPVACSTLHWSVSWQASCCGWLFHASKSCPCFHLNSAACRQQHALRSRHWM